MRKFSKSAWSGYKRLRGNGREVKRGRASTLSCLSCALVSCPTVQSLGTCLELKMKAELGEVAQRWPWSGEQRQDC